jgi:hypothetical protein
MLQHRLGDDVDDYCIRCKRLTNHSIVSLMDGRPAKVRCRSCYAEQDFRDGVAPPSKRDLEKAKLFNAVLASVPAAAAEAPEPDPPPAKEAKKPRKKA